MRKSSFKTAAFTLIELLVVITIIAILVGIALPTFSKVQEKGNITKGMNNARQVGLALKLYASDNDGRYPDSAPGFTPISSNDVMRELVKDGQVTNEAIFGCPASSKGNPDGDLGEPDQHLEAATPGENHWDMARGLNDSTPGNYPLLWENALSATWNPRWDPTQPAVAVDGRTWSGGKVILLLNDGSVATYRVANRTSQSELEDLGQGGRNLFTSAARANEPQVLGAQSGN